MRPDTADAADASERSTVAVVGSGVAGLTAAYLLQRRYDVTLFEAADRLGGHAHTHQLATRAGGALAVDSGFIVHNDRTYPHLRRLFGELGVAVQPTEMSMSIRCEGCGLEYAGGRGAKGIIAQRRRVADPRFWSLLVQVRRFHAMASKFLRTAPEDDLTTYGDFLTRHGFGAHFVQHYAVPVVSCVWSAGHQTALQYPARYLFAFLDHHGMLAVKGAPQWYTVTGGSRTYVDRLAATLDRVRTATPVRDITRKPDAVELRDAGDRVHRADRVVIATHADQALQLLTDPTDAERDVLGAFGYSTNDTLLHTDARILPRARQAKASWNYLMTSCTARPEATLVSYWMNRLHGHAGERDYVVTLNGRDRVDPASVLAEMSYDHPLYTPESVAAQRRLPELDTDVTAFAGAYHGWGFHEDGCRSGVQVARRFGVDW
ncbi:MAG TPA: FAD-dependent oxidoreductase [Nocardioidaceae bacterium]|nr:FAD-dependent oxidoreductase [Nocardioidaceae bacterium]